MSEFSKGQWHVESKAQLICNEDNVIAEVFYPRREREQTPEGKAEQAAHCRLIAAAPEMYELLKAVIDYKPDFIWDVVSKAQELLERINGKEVE